MKNLLVLLLRSPLGRVLKPLLEGINAWTIEVMKRAYKTSVRPRNWSNEELRRFAHIYHGSIINVSGWKDEDKTGGHYRDYFCNAASYSISNISGERGASAPTDIFINLEGELPEHLKRRYDVVFNHTVLEHIYDIRKAVRNLCELSSDTVILVTPFLQQVHYEPGSYGDYWRPTPAAIGHMLAENGFTIIHQSANDNPWYIVYVFTIATRKPEAYANLDTSRVADRGLGSSAFGLRD